MCVLVWVVSVLPGARATGTPMSFDAGSLWQPVWGRTGTGYAAACGRVICGLCDTGINRIRLLMSSVGMGDGIGGQVLACMAGDMFEMSVTHFRKDNEYQYDRIERVRIAKVDDPDRPQYEQRTREDLERALRGRFVTCNVQARDRRTDVLLCNVFVQNPPEGF